VELRRIFVNAAAEELRFLLLAIMGGLDEGYDAEDVEAHCAEAASLVDIDDDAMMEPFVVYQGEPSPMIVDTFRKGPDKFEVVFMVGDPLVELVKTQAKKVCGVVPHEIL
jgi:hypothetical protein